MTNKTGGTRLRNIVNRRNVQVLALSTIFCLQTQAFAQDLAIVADNHQVRSKVENPESQWASHPWVPKPFAAVGANLESSGYFPVSVGVSGGITLENSHLFAIASGTVDNAKKESSKTGHLLSLSALVFPRFPRRWYFGGGVIWSGYQGSDYTKSSGRPVFGGGKDIFLHGSSMRLQSLYILPGNDHSNAVQGVQFTMWFPSPASKHHVFFRLAEGIYEYHQSAVPNNPGTGHRGVMSTLGAQLLWRF